MFFMFFCSLYYLIYLLFMLLKLCPPAENAQLGALQSTSEVLGLGLVLGLVLCPGLVLGLILVLCDQLKSSRK